MGSRTSDRHERKARRQRCHQDRRQTLQRATYHGNDQIRDAFLFHQAWMWAISMTPLLVAIPKRVMKPIMEATDKTPPEGITPMTPPMSASGRLIIPRSASRTEWKGKAGRPSKPVPISRNADMFD